MLQQNGDHSNITLILFINADAQTLIVSVIQTKQSKRATVAIVNIRKCDFRQFDGGLWIVKVKGDDVKNNGVSAHRAD